MSYIKVYVHYVWTTKNHLPLLDKEVRQKVFQHIKENAKDKNIYIDRINGYFDHVHCLVSLNADLSIGKIAQLLKGESSHWINQNKLTRTKFEWGTEYFAVAVDDKKLSVIRHYIENQELHHKKTLFSEEYKKFIKRYNFETDMDNLG
jgi:REP element-mobilizing transposase RayT